MNPRDPRDPGPLWLEWAVVVTFAVGATVAILWSATHRGPPVEQRAADVR